MQNDAKAGVLKRFKRIEGQMGGLSRMVEDGRYCIDIITQISAVRAALRRAEEEILRDHVSHCVEHAIVSGNKQNQRQKISEIIEILGRSNK
jgi:CsoR family transcriptional regulator, copper-sensing transcriptional repressor